LHTDFLHAILVGSHSNKQVETVTMVATICWVSSNHQTDSFIQGTAVTSFTHSY